LIRTDTSFLFAAILLASAGALLWARGDRDVIPDAPPLKTFPWHLGAWSGTDLDILPEERKILGDGDFLSREYVASDAALPPVQLFIAYYPSQRTGDTIHSPRHCLPGHGFSPVANDTIWLSFPGHAPFPANRYIVAKQDARALVLYWYWAHDRGQASEYWVKYFLIRDSIKLNRSDGALIRIILVMRPGESGLAAEQRALPFTNLVLPLMNDYIPR